MKITEQDLKNISLLSKIKIDEETSDSLTKDLESILTMVNKMDEEGFGHCTNTGACEAECPKEISLEYIRKMNWEYHRANIKG